MDTYFTMKMNLFVMNAFWTLKVRENISAIIFNSIEKQINDIKI